LQRWGAKFCVLVPGRAKGHFQSIDQHKIFVKEWTLGSKRLDLDEKKDAEKGRACSRTVEKKTPIVAIRRRFTEQRARRGALKGRLVVGREKHGFAFRKRKGKGKRKVRRVGGVRGKLSIIGNLRLSD